MTKEGLLLIEGWARDGLTNEQIAHNMGISRGTLDVWAKKYKDIMNTLKTNKEIADRYVENSLFKRAMGFEYEEVTEEYDKHSQKMIVTKRTKKYISPDTTAIIFWLKNRKPKDWRDKPKQENDSLQHIENNLNILTQSMLDNIAPTRKIEDFEE